MDQPAGLGKTAEEVPNEPVVTGRSWWTVSVFFLFYTLAYIDRQILNYLVDPITRSLGISDFQFSLANGLVFAMLFAVAGVPIGWLVDRRSRRAIVAAGVVAWSIGAAICGMAKGYGQFLIGRIGLAAGEATLTPGSYSSVSDQFPPARLSMPMAVMTAGSTFGSTMAAIIAGWALTLVPDSGLVLPVLGHLWPWQVAMIGIAIPGILLMPLLFTIPEPARQPRPKSASRRNEAFAEIRRYPRFYSGYFVGFGFYSCANFAMTSWLPTFFIRHHGWTVGKAAFAVGLLHAGAAIPGTLVMGWIVDKWFSGGRRDAHAVFFGIAALIQASCFGAAMLVGSPWLALALLVPVKLLTNHAGVGGAGLQIVAPPRLRGQLSAIYLMVFSLLGAGIGPSVTAVFTDFVFKDPLKIGSALLVSFTFCAVIASALLFSSAATMRRMQGAKA